ncbi:hypothetical protein P4O66_020135, partial [Electrophorus voltai]
TSSNLSHSSTYCPTDVKMVKVCISEVSSTEDRTKKATAQSNDPAVVDHVKTHNDDCNQDATLAFHKTKLISVDSARALGPAACGTADEKRHSGSETNVDPAGREDCVVSSANPPFSASSESCSTVGSGEMVFRSNSFLLHESDQLLSASLLGESSDMQSEAGLVLGLLPDVCEGLVNSKVSTSGRPVHTGRGGSMRLEPRQTWRLAIGVQDGRHQSRASPSCKPSAACSVDIKAQGWPSGEKWLHHHRHAFPKEQTGHEPRMQEHIIVIFTSVSEGCFECLENPSLTTTRTTPWSFIRRAPTHLSCFSECCPIWLCSRSLISCLPFWTCKMLFSPRFSLSNIHVKLTAKGLLRSLQLLSGCKKSTVVFRTEGATGSRDGHNLSRHSVQWQGSRGSRGSRFTACLGDGVDGGSHDQTPGRGSPTCGVRVLEGARRALKGSMLNTGPLLSGCSLPVDKGRVKASTRGQASGQPDLVPPETKPRGVEYYKTLCERKNQTIQQLKSSFRASSRRFEAIAVVVQNLYAEHEDTVKRRQELSLELLNLHENLVSSVQACERLEQDKEELRAAFDGVLQKVQEQHCSDLLDLEERLKTFYLAEWEKVHQTYQEEADKCKAHMEQQLDELKASHETMKKELEASHEEKVESLKEHYEQSLEEIKKSHEQEMQALEKTLKDAEATLSNRIEELTTENNVLNERLKVEEDQRRQFAEKYQKDSHTLYLEQELDSLKVVLDIKNKQIHQQDKKLMQLDKLIEKNVKLDECLNKVQQENEDLKARMDKHAALSRQLSTEQAALQESLQKETKVNKRLSMENEELLWKLQNGDLSSPRKISPSSTSVGLRSPRNSDVFSSLPVSPR